MEPQLFANHRGMAEHRRLPTPCAQLTDSAVAKPAAWRVLVVDDDPDTLDVTRLMLRDVRCDGRGLIVNVARGDAEARALLASLPDLAVAMIDVVLHGTESGLDLVQYMRTTLGNRTTRIVLRTGCPQIAPERAMFERYDINAYLNKAFTDAPRIHSTMLTAIRSYHEVTQLQSVIDDLERVANTDGLTGLHNKNTLRMAYSRVIRAASRRAEPVALMFLDVDDFKRINDVQGHVRGDELLHCVAKVIRETSREDDLCFRYGGDEFLVILPHCSKELAARHYLARLKENFTTIGITVSVGIAEAQAPSYADLEDMLARADTELYEAKRISHAARPARGEALFVAHDAVPLDAKLLDARAAPTLLAVQAAAAGRRQQGAVMDARSE